NEIYKVDNTNKKDEFDQVDDANKEDEFDDTNKENEFNQIKNSSVSKHRGHSATKRYKLATETKKNYTQNISVEHAVKQDIILRDIKIVR
ncbi:10339_t:CDS:1, partial [Dentiscutata erythropus]